MDVRDHGSSANVSISAPFIANHDVQRGGLVRNLLKQVLFLSSNATGETHQTNTATASKGITVVCVADTHNMKPELPRGHVLLHAGDLSQYGLFDEIQAQLDWLNSQPHLHKIIVPGNHDLLLDPDFVKTHPDRELGSIPGKRYRDLRWGDVQCLVDSYTHIGIGQQTLTIFGSPLTSRCGNFAFQYEPDTDVWHNKLPDNVDILLTHGPPALHLDKDKGCKYLLREIRRAQPRWVVFGHIHNGRGEERVEFNGAQTCYEEAVLGTWPWIKLPFLVFHVIVVALTRFIRAEPRAPLIHLVNAAVACGPGNSSCKEAIVVEI